LNGGTALTLRAGSGTVTFTGTVGGTNALTNLAFTSAGTINVGNYITLTGANPLTFPSAVVLSGTTSVITNTNQNVTFSSTLNGANNLSLVVGTGSVTFTGAVGATTALTSLVASGTAITQTNTVTTTGTVSYTGSAINVNGNITTSGGTISMTGPVAITGAPTFDNTNGGGTPAGNVISFSSTLNGATALTLRAGSGTVTFTGTVGGTNALTNLAFTSAGTINVGNS